MAQQIERHGVADIETLSTCDRAVVTSIGIVAFTRHELLEANFRHCHMQLGVQEQLNCGRVIDASTLHFWLTQDGNVRANEVDVGLRLDVPVQETLIELYEWFAKNSVVCLWGNGSTFDNIILKSLFHMFELQWPFAYNADRDLRTLLGNYGISKSQVQVNYDTSKLSKHSAIDDAKLEALYMRHVLQKYPDAIAELK